MVSAGVVLVTTPIVGLYYLLCNGNQILISQAECDALSSTSMRFLEQRDKAILFILRALPYLLGFLILIGLICLIYGGVKWHNTQREIDTQTKLKTREQKFNVEKLTASEIAVKAIDEVSDESEIQNEKQETTSSAMYHDVIKAIEIENLCYSYVRHQHSKSYYVQQNVKLNNYACDILTVSKTDEIDYLFEIKYWTHIPNSALFNRTINSINVMSTSYEFPSQRNCKVILMVVTVDGIKEKLKELCDRYVSENSVSADIQIYTEDDLK